MSDSTAPFSGTWPSWLSDEQIADAETVLDPGIVRLIHVPPVREAQAQFVRVLIAEAVTRGHDTGKALHAVLTPQRLSVLLMSDPTKGGTPLRCPACGRVYLHDPQRPYDPLTAGSDGLPCLPCLATMPTPPKAAKPRPSQARTTVTRRRNTKRQATP